MRKEQHGKNVLINKSFAAIDAECVNDGFAGLRESLLVMLPEPTSASIHWLPLIHAFPQPLSDSWIFHHAVQFYFLKQ